MHTPRYFFILSKDGGVIKHRKQLPIWDKKSAIIESILQNKVTVITGETGSGKTTQVPQYLLEYATDNQSSCKIICAEPRRLGIKMLSIKKLMYVKYFMRK